MRNKAGAVKWATGLRTEDIRRSQHIELRYHHIREAIRSEEVHVQKINTGQMAADCLTKRPTNQEVKRADDRPDLHDTQASAEEE